MIGGWLSACWTFECNLGLWSGAGFELTRSHADIIQGELSHSGVELEQQRERLADTTGSAEDGDLGQL